MDIDVLQARIAAARDPLRRWLDDASTLALPDHALKVELLAQVSVAVEELGLASESLEDQNEVLAATRSELAVERQRHRELFSSSPAPCLIMDRNGGIHEANAAALALLDSTGDQISGKPLLEFVADGQRERLRACLEAARNRAATESCEVDLGAVTGGSRRALLSLSALATQPGEDTLLRCWIQQGEGIDSAPEPQ